MTQTLGRRATRTRIVVLAADPVSRAGVAGVLRYRDDLEMVSVSALTDPDQNPSSRPDVAVLVTETVDRETIARIRTVRQTGTRVVVLTRDLNGPSVLDTVNAGASAIVRRVEATDERLTEAIRVAAVGDGSLPRDLTNRLLHQVGASRTSGGPGASGTETARDTSLTHRELRILRLLADGFSTLEIARELAYSERTIKQAVHSMTTRLSLRNRSHAVAFALRKGLI